MYSYLAFSFAALYGFTPPFSSTCRASDPYTICGLMEILSNPFQKEDFPTAEGSEYFSDPVPHIVRQRMEEAAGDAVVHHHLREQQHGMIVYTAHFTDSVSNVDQIITVAPDGNVLFIEPVLLTVPPSSHVSRGQLDTMAPVVTEMWLAVPSGKTSDVQLPDRLEILDPPKDLQGRDAAPASRMGRLENNY